MMMMNCFFGMVDQRRCSALFPAGTISRNPHHHRSLTCWEQDLNEGLIECSCAVVIMTAPPCNYESDTDIEANDEEYELRSNMIVDVLQKGNVVALYSSPNSV